ncbi:MAG: Holliday junction branch migration protein RuvA [Sphingomonadales bacterium]
MIAKLTGLLDSLGADWAIVDVGGVGYLVFCSAKTLAALPAPGQRVALLIETHVREDHIHLFGFAGGRELDWFRLLQNVQGVGAKVALAILSVLAPDQLQVAIAAQDAKAVARANGVGPKLAARIVNELKDKAAKLSLGVSAVSAASAASPAAAAAEGGEDTSLTDAVSALVNLGYSPSDAYGAAHSARRQLGEAAELSALIKAGLKELSQ